MGDDAAKPEQRRMDESAGEGPDCELSDEQLEAVVGAGTTPVIVRETAADYGSASKKGGLTGIEDGTSNTVMVSEKRG